jgi:hypothetical protein
MEIRRIQISRLVLQPEFSFRYLCHYEQHRIPKILPRMEQHLYARAADSVRANCVAQHEPVFLANDTRPGSR